MSGAQRVLITGGNAGIGFEAAKQLLKLGHHVMIACRDTDKAKRALEALTPVAKASGVTVESVQLDLASLASVRTAAQQVLRQPRLDVLLCNAGVFARKGSADPLELTKDGFEATLQVNHLGHFLLVHLLLPALLTSPAPRVVVVSSELHRKATAASPGPSDGAAAAAAAATESPAGNSDAAGGGGALSLASPEWLARLRAAASSSSSPPSRSPSAAAPAPQGHPTGFQLYCISKLYNLWFAYRLASLVPASVKVNAVTPGWVPGTSLGRDNAWLARMAYQYLFPLLPMTVSVSEGARRVVSVCVGQQEGAVTGSYFSRGTQTESSPESHDTVAAERLWVLSAEAAGIQGPYVPPPSAEQQQQ